MFEMLDLQCLLLWHSVLQLRSDLLQGAVACREDHVSCRCLSFFLLGCWDVWMFAGVIVW
jgi:hypothetical protein